MISIRFHDAARSELAEEVLYYADIDRRLGERLFEAVQRAVGLAAEFPEMGAPYLFKTRRVFPKRFPFCGVCPAPQRDRCSRCRSVSAQAGLLEIAQA